MAACEFVRQIAFAKLYRGVDQGVEPGELLLCVRAIGENDCGESAPVDLAVRVENLFAEGGDYGVVGLPALLEHLAAQHVSLDQETA
jgi:hypothetical protein